MTRNGWLSVASLALLLVCSAGRADKRSEALVSNARQAATAAKTLQADLLLHEEYGYAKE